MTEAGPPAAEPDASIHERLGDLELAILNVLWQAKEPLQVREVAQRLGRARAYTTVMTTLTRLSAKGYVNQHRDGRSFGYTARLPQSTVLHRMLRRIAEPLFGGDIYQLIPRILGVERALTDEERKRLETVAAQIRDPEDE